MLQNVRQTFTHFSCTWSSVICDFGAGLTMDDLTAQLGYERDKLIRRLAASKYWTMLNSRYSIGNCLPFCHFVRISLSLSLSLSVGRWTQELAASTSGIKHLGIGPEDDLQRRAHLGTRHVRHGTLSAERLCAIANKSMGWMDLPPLASRWWRAYRWATSITYNSLPWYWWWKMTISPKVDGNNFVGMWTVERQGIF